MAWNAWNADMHGKEPKQKSFLLDFQSVPNAAQGLFLDTESPPLLSHNAQAAQGIPYELAEDRAWRNGYQEIHCDAD